MFVLFGPTLTTRARLLSTDVLVVGDLAADASGATAVKIAAHNLLRKDSSGVLAIEDEAFDEKLRIKGTNSYISFLNTAGTVRRGYFGSFGVNLYVWNDSNGPSIFGTNNIERGRVDGVGNWGFGTAAPVTRVNVQVAGAAGNVVGLTLNNPHNYGVGQGIAAIGLRFARSPADGGSTGLQAEIFGGNESESTSTAGYLAFGVRNGAPEVTTEAMRITSGGALCIGTVSALASSRFTVLSSSNGMTVRCGNGLVGSYMSNTSGTGAWQPFSFCNNGATLSQIGSISCTATTTTYNTTSDRRLKDQIDDFGETGEFIDALRPRRWLWNTDGSPGGGFIADEFAEVFPDSVSGEKDAVVERPVVDPETGAAVLDADGEPVVETVPVYQSMQASSPEVMAAIIGELQSLRRRVAEAEATIAALSAASSNG